MESEILKTSPLSGKYEEHRYDATGNTMWVKFLDSEYLEWCGVFGLGWKSAQKEAHIKSLIFQIMERIFNAYYQKYSLQICY